MVLQPDKDTSCKDGAKTSSNTTKAFPTAASVSEHDVGDIVCKRCLLTTQKMGQVDQSLERSEEKNTELEDNIAAIQKETVDYRLRIAELEGELMERSGSSLLEKSIPHQRDVAVMCHLCSEEKNE